MRKKKKNNLSFVESSCRISLPLEFSLYVFCSARADSQHWLRLQITTPKTHTEEAIFRLFIFLFLFIHWFLVTVCVRACMRCPRACASVRSKWRSRCHQRWVVVAISIAVYKRQYVTPSSSTTILATRYTITRSTRSPHPPPLCLKEFYPPPPISLPTHTTILPLLSSLRLFSPLVSYPPSLPRMLAHYERLNGFR